LFQAKTVVIPAVAAQKKNDTKDKAMQLASKITKRLAPEFPSEHFWDFYQRGMEGYDELRADIAAIPGQMNSRVEKTWGVKETASMVGVTPPTLRKLDPDPPKYGGKTPRWTLQRINELRKKAGTLLTRPEGAECLTLAFSKLKGGTGNTSNAVHFSHFLAMKGYRVLFIDWDPQASATGLCGGYNPDADITMDDLPLASILGDYEGFSDCIKTTYFHNVHLCPANQMLEDLNIELPDQIATAQRQNQPVDPDFIRLKKCLDTVKDFYDFIIIDCPPSPGVLTMNALGAADGIINPIVPNPLDRASYIMHTKTLANHYEVASAPLKYHRIMLTKYNGSLNQQENISDIRRIYGDWVLFNPGTESVEVSKSSARLETIYSLEKAMNAQETLKRALDHFNAAFEEMLAEMSVIWEMEAEANE
jgi:chromosome partitioning protein